MYGIDVHDGLETLLAQTFDGDHEVPRSATDDKIDFTEGVDGLLHGGVELLGVPDVGLAGDAFLSRCLGEFGG